MRITETSGNSKNGISGQRISVYSTVENQMYLVDRFVVTSMYGAINYCNNHPAGKYAKRFNDALETAKKIEKSGSIAGFQKVDSRYRII